MEQKSDDTGSGIFNLFILTTPLLAFLGGRVSMAIVMLTGAILC